MKLNSSSSAKEARDAGLRARANDEERFGIRGDKSRTGGGPRTGAGSKTDEAGVDLASADERDADVSDAERGVLGASGRL